MVGHLRRVEVFQHLPQEHLERKAEELRKRRRGGEGGDR
jgi:hypothetical protein